LAIFGEIAEPSRWSWLWDISDIVMASMAMPSIFMLPDAESCVSTSSEWQSEFIEANPQESSQAAPSEDTDSNSATIEPANMRRIFIPGSMLRQDNWF
jgi:hypothetical protein